VAACYTDRGSVLALFGICAVEIVGGGSRVGQRSV
jgi:hypothetical protein